MFVRNQNKLAKPEVLKVLPFRQQLESFKQGIIDYIAAADPVLAMNLQTSFKNEAELLTKLIEACTIVLQTRIREVNEDALQMFAYWSEGSNLDVVVSNLGLKREVIEPAKPDAYPPVLAKMEPDESLRDRYFLSPFSFSNGGPELAYQYHALTLGERPRIALERPSDNELVVRYTFDDQAVSNQIKDASSHRAAPGEIVITLLSYIQSKLYFADESDFDEVNSELNDVVKLVDQYLHRKDIKVATDKLSVQLAELVAYTIEITLNIYKGPDSKITEKDVLKVINRYVENKFRLGASIEKGQIYHELYSVGAESVELELYLMGGGDKKKVEKVVTDKTKAPLFIPTENTLKIKQI